MNNDLEEFLNEQDSLMNNNYFDLDNNIINPAEPIQNIFSHTHKYFYNTERTLFLFPFAE